MIKCIKDSQPRGVRIRDIPDSTLFTPVCFPNEIWLRTDSGGVRLDNTHPTVSRYPIIYRTTAELDNVGGKGVNYEIWHGVVTITEQEGK